MVPVDHSLKEAFIQYEAVTEKVIGCAYKVYNQMGFGFLESVYENCMVIELGLAGLNVDQQQPISVHDHGEVVGENGCPRYRGKCHHS